MDMTIDQFSTYITKALCYKNKGKYRNIVVKGSTTGLEITLEAQFFHIPNPDALKAEAQARFETLIEANPNYSDQTYLACVAYEETIRKHPANGRSTTET